MLCKAIFHAPRKSHRQSAGRGGGGRGWGSQCAASLIGAHYPQRQTTTTTATDDKAEKKQDTSEASIAHGVRRAGNSGSVFRRRWAVALWYLLFMRHAHILMRVHTHTHTQSHICINFATGRSKKEVEKEQRNREGSLTVNALRLTEHDRGRREGSKRRRLGKENWKIHRMG